jgi:hypothetical protein
MHKWLQELSQINFVTMSVFYARVSSWIWVLPYDIFKIKIAHHFQCIADHLVFPLMYPTEICTVLSTEHIMVMKAPLQNFYGIMYFCQNDTLIFMPGRLITKPVWSKCSIFTCL